MTDQTADSTGMAAQAGGFPAAGVAATGSALGDFIVLLKPKVMSLVVFTGLAGLLAAPGSIHPVIAAVAVLCIAVGAGAAGAINMWYERDIDAVMARTAGRPLPQGRMTPEDALGFGVLLSLLSVMMMGLAVNWTAAALLALANGFYVLVYTVWLKRRTPQNIVIGGAAGAFPPMIGWAAVTGGVSLESLVLFGLIFLWTPPHFWALALFTKVDYARAGVPMLPVVAGRDSTCRQMLLYTVLLLPVSVLPALLGTAGIFYGVMAAVLSMLFICCALRVWQNNEDRPAKQMFGYSVFYLFMIFALLVMDGRMSLA